MSEVKACPNCDSSQIYQRIQKTPKYYCEMCGSEFEEPEERKSKSPGPSLNEGRRKVRCYNCSSVTIVTSEGDFSCSECGAKCSYWRGRISFFRENKFIQQLAEGPVTSDELDGRLTPEVRGVVYRLVPQGSGGASKTRPNRNQACYVYYFEGDLRQACSLFIEENTEYVRDCLSDHPNPLQTGWSEEKYMTLVEQFEWLGYNEVEEDD